MPLWLTIALAIVYGIGCCFGFLANLANNWDREPSLLGSVVLGLLWPLVLVVLALMWLFEELGRGHP